MTMSRPSPRGTRRLRAAALLAAALASGVAPLAGADPEPGSSAPDAFGTAAALRRGTAGLDDPLDRDCPMPSELLSLSIAIDVALCRNPATRTAWAAARVAAAALGAAEGAWLPSLTLSGGISRDSGDHVDVSGQLVSTPQTTRDAALNLSWLLYDFGGREAKIRGARGALDAQAALVNNTVQQTILNVVQAYYTAVAGEATLDSARRTEATAEQSVEIARALRQGGVATLADELQAETARDQSVIARVQADAAAKSARGSLAIALGTPADRAMKLRPEPVPAEVPTLNARMADLMAEAMRQRPDLAAARAQRDTAEANVTVARATGRPVISLGAGRDFMDTSGIPNQRYNQIGLTVTVPLFNGFNTSYAVRQAEAALKQSEANEDQVRLNASLAVWNGYTSLQSANQLLASAATLVRTGERNEEVALGRYRSGVGTILDVLTAQTAASTARLARINAELGWQVSRAELAAALGRLSGLEPLATLEGR